MDRKRSRIAVDLAWFGLGWLVLVALLASVLSMVKPDYSLTRLFALALIFLVSEGGAVLLARFPAGDEFVMLRLGGAAFCRTIVPLLLSLTFAWYSNGPLGRADIVPLLCLYGYGIVLGTVLSVRYLRLEKPSGGPKR